MKTRATITTLIALTWLLSCLVITNEARAQLGERIDTRRSTPKHSKEESQEPGAHASEEGINCRPVMWQDPVDLERRDLFYGNGGQEGAPDPVGKFILLKHDREGSARKIQVKDGRGRTWRVKFGPEPRPETAATRILWAVGYHVDQAYFVRHARIEGYAAADVSEVRFERDNDGYKRVGRWDWNSNPFVGTRELDGLKTLMALLNNYDLKEENNKIVTPASNSCEPAKHIYFVSDLGATLGSSGHWFTELPLLGELPTGSKGVAKQFAEHGFIDGVSKGEVRFHMQRRRANRALKDVKVENARWMGDLMARLSDKQIGDAFRAGGFDESETAVYVRALRDRIRQLQELR
jgi:hypothetical protein